MAERFNCLRCRQMARDIRPAGNIVGPRVRRLRNARGWSQPELAARCQRIGWDIGRDIIARIESQVRLVTDSEILFLAKRWALPLSSCSLRRRDGKNLRASFFVRKSLGSNSPTV